MLSRLGHAVLNLQRAHLTPATLAALMKHARTHTRCPCSRAHQSALVVGGFLVLFHVGYREMDLCAVGCHRKSLLERLRAQANVDPPASICEEWEE